ncbi:MAG: hypothetical protein SFV54_07635, partial [Bryobacteraceae bacterium]|nr:hypothetical protein [Bryobacteraceae bacterium]
PTPRQQGQLLDLFRSQLERFGRTADCHTPVCACSSTSSTYFSLRTLDRYVGVYSIPGEPNRVVNITRDGATLYFKPASQATGVALEATAENKFKSGPVLVFEFDAEKGEMIIHRAGQRMVFRKQQE